MGRYIGIDIGGTKCAVSLGNEKAEVIKSVKFPTQGPSETVARILDEAKNMLLLSDEPVVSAGISCGSPLDPVKGIIQSPPNLPGWDNIEIVRLTEERLGIPAILCNDANACALAEWKFGAGRGCNNMVFLTFGTGNGAGLILDGKLYNGANGNAGEIGHIRLDRHGPVGYGKRGSFEGFASGGGIAQVAKTAALEKLQCGKSVGYCRSWDELDSVNAKNVALAAENGDETAIEVYRLVGEMLGRGLSIIVDVINPERIVIGSIYQRSGHLLKESMERVLKEECLPQSLGVCRILPAELGDDIGNRAALTLAISIDKQ
ncbi:MAG: ROK family protein [Clostridia bacterium]|nr:ROK family protein [Clostridia bacterium]